VTLQLSARPWIPQALGLLAFLGFLLLTMCLGRLEWLDTYVASRLDRRYSPDSPCMICLTRDAPYLAAALVVVSGLVAFRRGATLAEVVQVLIPLAIGLLLVEGLKLLITASGPAVSFSILPRVAASRAGTSPTLRFAWLLPSPS